MHVLFLSQWYPHRYDAMVGLFVRKHAQAVVRQGIDVTVLYLHHDEHIRKEELLEQVTNGVREVYVYYPHALGYLKACRHGYQYIKRKWGRPDLCQLNILSKNGILPLYLWKRYSIPYIIIEHWSGYLPMNRSHAIPNGWHKHLMQLICRNAQVVMPVSKSLQQAMQECGFECQRWQVIHNVVDDFFYKPYSRPTGEPIEIAHVSCFENKSKNIKGLLRSIKELSSLRSDFHVTMVGTGIDFNQDVAYAKQLGLSSLVTFTGELLPEQVAEELRQADAMLLFSNYENAPVVISEALAIGIPVFSTNVGGIAEMVNKDCGILVEACQEKEMAQVLKQYINGNLCFDSTIIRQYGEQYSFDTVGKELANLYYQLIRE